MEPIRIPEASLEEALCHFKECLEQFDADYLSALICGQHGNVSFSKSSLAPSEGIPRLGLSIEMLDNNHPSTIHAVTPLKNVNVPHHLTILHQRGESRLKELAKEVLKQRMIAAMAQRT